MINGSVPHVIRNECEGVEEIPLGDLIELQGELKSLSEKAYKQLKIEIIQRGFSFPVAVWRSPEGMNYILDGHQRTRVLRQLASEGWRVPDVPVIFVHAENLMEARLKLLAAASQYGQMESEGLFAFMHDGGIDFETLEERFRFPEIRFDRFEQEWFKDPEEKKPEKQEQNDSKKNLKNKSEPEVLSGSARTDVEPPPRSVVKCPSCGMIF